MSSGAKARIKVREGKRQKRNDSGVCVCVLSTWFASKVKANTYIRLDYLTGTTLEAEASRLSVKKTSNKPHSLLLSDQNTRVERVSQESTRGREGEK